MTSESKKQEKKTIRVAAAVIRNGDKVFCAQRAYGFLKGKWEFPGGKIEQGETPEEAVVREIKEELDTVIKVDGFFVNVKYEYSDFVLDMDCFECHVVSGRLGVEKQIHSAEKWVNPKRTKIKIWCPADRLVVAKLEQ